MSALIVYMWDITPVPVPATVGAVITSAILTINSAQKIADAGVEVIGAAVPAEYYTWLYQKYQTLRRSLDLRKNQRVVVKHRTFFNWIDYKKTLGPHFTYEKYKYDIAA